MFSTEHNITILLITNTKTRMHGTPTLNPFKPYTQSYTQPYTPNHQHTQDVSVPPRELSHGVLFRAGAGTGGESTCEEVRPEVQQRSAQLPCLRLPLPSESIPNTDGACVQPSDVQHHAGGGGQVLQDTQEAPVRHWCDTHVLGARTLLKHC